MPLGCATRVVQLLISPAVSQVKLDQAKAWNPAMAAREDAEAKSDEANLAK